MSTRCLSLKVTAVESIVVPDQSEVAEYVATWFDVPANHVAVSGNEAIVLDMKHNAQENIAPITNLFQLSHRVEALRSEFQAEKKKVEDLEGKVEDLEGKVESVQREVEAIRNIKLRCAREHLGMALERAIRNLGPNDTTKSPKDLLNGWNSRSKDPNLGTNVEAVRRNWPHLSSLSPPAIKLAVDKPSFVQQGHDSSHSFSTSDVRSVREDIESRAVVDANERTALMDLLQHFEDHPTEFLISKSQV